MNDKQELKAKLMGQIIAEAFNGQAAKMDAPMSNVTISQFLTNVERIVDEILKRSSK